MDEDAVEHAEAAQGVEIVEPAVLHRFSRRRPPPPLATRTALPSSPEPHAPPRPAARAGEGEEGRLGAAQPRPAARRPEAPPLGLEPVGIEPRRHARAPARGPPAPSRGPLPRRRRRAAPRARTSTMSPSIERQRVVGQPVLLGHVADHLAEHPPRAGRAGLLQQRLEPDLPLRLPAAMLAGDLVDPPLQRLAQPEIVPVQRQHRLRQHRAVDPVRQRHRDQDHPPAARSCAGSPRRRSARSRGSLSIPPVAMLVTIRVPDSRSQRLAQPPVAVAARSRAWWRPAGRGPSGAASAPSAARRSPPPSAG